MSGQITESTDQIYFIQSLDNKRVKIGVSRSPIKRLRTLQTGCSERLDLLFYVEGSRESEQECHKKFSHLRHKGEWFDYDPRLHDFMVELWRNRQAHRASFMGFEKKNFYSFLRYRNYNWENKVEVNGLLYRFHGEWGSKTRPQQRAIDLYERYERYLRDTKNQQLTGAKGYTQDAPIMPVEKPSSEEKDFWENVLHDHRLGMNRGRRAWISYGHEDREKDADAFPEESE